MKTEKKSERQVLEEFEILNSLFDFKSVHKDEEDVAEKVMDAVSLADNSYQDLWQKMVGDIKVIQSEPKKQKTKGLGVPMDDSDF